MAKKNPFALEYALIYGGGDLPFDRRDPRNRPPDRSSTGNKNARQW